MDSNSIQPLISVIIPTYNRAKLLERAIKSVLDQTYSNLECIVVDDASTDETKEIVSLFQKDSRVLYLRHEMNRRGASARNTGIAHSSGDLIAFLDDDDQWLPTKLQKQVYLMSNSPKDVGLVYCWMDYYGSNGEVFEEHHPNNRGYVFPLLLDTNRIGGCPTLLIRKSVIDNVGGFNEALTYEDDYEFIMRVCKDYNVDLIEEVLVRVDYGHGLPQTSFCNYDDRKFCLKCIASLKAKINIVDTGPQEYKYYVFHYCNAIAYVYGSINNWYLCLLWLYRAFKRSPFNLETLLVLPRLAKWRIMKIVAK